MEQDFHWNTVKFQNYAPPNITPQTRNTKNLPGNHPSKYKPPKGLYLEIALKCKTKQSKNGKFPSIYKLAQSILKRKFPSVHKPLQKGPLKKISPRTYFRNFTVDHFWAATSFCFTVKLRAKPLIWKWFFILMQMQLIFTTTIFTCPCFESESFWNSEIALPTIFPLDLVLRYQIIYQIIFLFGIQAIGSFWMRLSAFELIHETHRKGSHWSYKMIVSSDGFTYVLRLNTVTTAV